jgi:hypothetical protein
LPDAVHDDVGDMSDDRRKSGLGTIGREDRANAPGEKKYRAFEYQTGVLISRYLG